MKLAFLLTLLPLSAQDVPVVLLNGYQADCQTPSRSSATFASLESLLSSAGWRVFFFDNCSVPSPSRRPSIETLGQAFSQFLRASNLNQVDVVAHSMGGLIVRAYLSGKSGAGFNPPPRPAIRKAIFLATPHAGILAQAALLTKNPDLQLTQLFQGSPFLWDLATWNQGTDDLREIDAISIAGDAAPGNLHDGAVSITSAAFSVVLDDARAIIVPYCHQDAMPSFLCDRPGIAAVNSPQHISYRIIRSFFSGTEEWKTLGTHPSQNATLSRFGGLFLNYRDSANRPGAATRAEFSTAALSGELLFNSTGGFFSDLLPSGDYQFRLTTPQGPETFSWSSVPGNYPVLLRKPGPNIARLQPAPATLPTLSLAPGMQILLRGAELDGASLEIGGLPAQILDLSAQRILAVIPEIPAGLAKVRLSNAKGVAETQIFLDQAVPAVFSQGDSGLALAFHSDGTVVTTDVPAKPGETITLYLTGLGSPLRIPTVTLGGQSAFITSASKIADQPGIDRIDFVIPDSVTDRSPLPLAVSFANRTSNPTLLPVSP